MVRTSWVGVVVLAIALMVSGCSDDKAKPKAGPTPSASPSYYAAGVPYVFRQVLYIDHKEQPGRWIRAQSAGGYTAVERQEDPLGFGMVVLDSATGKQVLAAAHVISSPIFSPHGTKLAWVTQIAPAKAVLVVQDLKDFAEAGRLAIAINPKHPSVDLGSVTDSGRTYYTSANKPLTWAPGGSPKKGEDPGTAFVNPPGFAGVKQQVRLSVDQLWGAWIGPGGDLVLQHPGDPSSRVEIERPTLTGHSGIVQWDAPTKVTIDSLQEDRHGQPVLVACDVTTLTCDYVDVH